MSTVHYEPECELYPFRDTIFLNSLTQIEHESYVFAKNHLACSFDLRLSNAYIKWETQALYKYAQTIQRWIRRWDQHRVHK